MDRNRFVSLLTGSIGHLCKAGYSDSKQRVCRVDGLLGITLSTGEVFLVNICESFIDSANCGNSTVQNDGFDTVVDFYSRTVAPEIANASAKQSDRNLGTMKEEYDTSVDTTGLCTILPTKADSSVKSNEIRNINNYKLITSISPESLTMSDNAVAECYNEQAGLTTLIKVESSDDCQVLHDINTSFKNKFDFDSSQKYSNMLEQELQTMEDKSSVFSQMCTPENENYTLHTNFSHQNHHNPLQESSNVYKYSLDLANNSETVLCKSGVQENSPVNRISTQKNRHLVTQRRKGRGKYKWRYDAATMRQCIEFVRTRKMSQREAEKVFQIPRTTIQYKMAQLYPKCIAHSHNRKFY